MLPVISGRRSPTRYGAAGTLPSAARWPRWGGVRHRASSGAKGGRWPRLVSRLALGLVAIIAVSTAWPASVLAAACAPRPPVGVQVVEAADGRLQVLVRAGSGPLHE